MMPRRGLELSAVAGSIGTEVRGVDLGELDDATWEYLHDLWLERHVLFFPDQRLDPDAHVAFGRRFGVPEIHPYIDKLDDSHPEIIFIETRNGGVDVFHTDVTFSPTPPMASILQMIACPPSGGDTLFTDQERAFETLSPALRAFLEHLTAVHSARVFGHAEQTATHPLVRIHPETGRKALFVNRTFTDHVVELAPAESEHLLEYLYRWSEQPNFQCRYRWVEGAVGIWDNRCTQHFAVADYNGYRRIERVTILGDRPLGGGSSWEPHTPTDAADVRDDGSRRYELDPRANSIDEV